MAPKPPKGGSISPVPPPLQFANSEIVSSSKHQTSSSAAFSYSAQTKHSSNISNSSSRHHHHQKTGVKVLPSLSQPVQLQEPAAAEVAQAVVSQAQKQHSAITNIAISKDHVDSINSNEADHFIEQLMQEAETDPKLRELTYGSNNHNNNNSAQQQVQPSIATFEAKYARPTACATPTLSLNETYPMINRPYRTAQDIKIQDHENNSSSAVEVTSTPKTPVERHKMPERPYRTNEDIKIVEKNRSKSADSRLHHKAFNTEDPKLSTFTGKHSSTNVTEDLLNEVVTDKSNRSVKDLIAMMEQSTKTESINPYVRKWGCDLISPEPHKRNGPTYRMEKRQIVDQNELNKSLEKHQRTFTWKQDDLFKRQHRIENGHSTTPPEQSEPEIQQKVLSHLANNHSPSGRDDHESYLDSHTADLDELIGNRRPSLEDVIDAAAPDRNNVVVWPPPSPLPPIPDQNNSYPSPMFSPSPPPPLAVAAPLPPSTPSPIPPSVEINGAPAPSSSAVIMPKKSNLKKRSQSEGTRRRFSNSSLHEIDQQIVMIQNEFEAELDTLIDAYRDIQHSKKKG